ncbi:unnamed protein product [Discula destructiva]
MAIAQSSERAEKSNTSGLRLRLKEHSPSVPLRRRKVSVPELGPMTTVHESSMDSPTIPGRPILHERSASAPGNSWKHLNLTFKSSSARKTESKSFSEKTRLQATPKDLPPLTIPPKMSALSPLKRQLSTGHPRSGNTNNDITRSGRADDCLNPKTPHTPPSSTQSTSSTPGSAATAFSPVATFALTTPALVVPEGLHDPSRLRWAGSVTPTSGTRTETSSPFAAAECRTGSHRRHVSDSSSMYGSIMDRGRPKKGRIEGLKDTDSRKNKSTERLAFEALPKGWRVLDAATMLDSSERIALKKQALQQAGKFEILRKSDVDSLSRELRNLDERCEYLRRTYHSLRAGRRNLHARICSYLCSPRMVKFSQESLLKQEEALAELDSSIDDWVRKFELAENRRTRVRQKLLEHVAAAVILPVQGDDGTIDALHLSLGIKSPNALACPSTPPRSPTKGSVTPQTPPTPQALPTPQMSPNPQRVVAQVPSTIIEQPVIEEAAAVGLGIESASSEPSTVAGIRRAEVESIRIYAGDEVAALLADVEQEITRMSQASEHHAVEKREKEAGLLCDDAKLSGQERRELHHARSAGAVQAGTIGKPSDATLPRPVDSASGTTTKLPMNSTARATTPTVTEEKEEDLTAFLLPSAVFNPKTAVVS